MTYPGWNEENRVVAHLLDGRTMAKGYTKQVVAAGNVYMTVTIPNLVAIEEVIQFNFRYDPSTIATGPIGEMNIAGNVVGVTVYDILAGTTLTLEIIAIGV
jgi:hypothetical protein